MFPTKRPDDPEIAAAIDTVALRVTRRNTRPLDELVWFFRQQHGLLDCIDDAGREAIATDLVNIAGLTTADYPDTRKLALAIIDAYPEDPFY